MSGQDAEIGMKCIKYMLFTTNFLFSMIGFLLISVGSTITSIYADFETFMETQMFSPAALLISIGVIIFFVSLFGCFGAFRKSTCLINMYAVFLTVVLILEISVIIAAYAMKSTISENIELKMYESMNKYNINGENEETYSWDYLQTHLYCCGVLNSSDWTPFVGIPPNTCYRYDEIQHPILNENGCLPALTFIVSECASLVGTGGLCVAIVQVLGIVFACMLAKSIRRFKTEMEMQRQENIRFYAQLAQGNPTEKPSPVIYIPTEANA